MSSYRLPIARLRIPTREALACLGILVLGVAVVSATASAATRALVIGIDDYAGERRLRGAAADARDIAAALRRTGATDVEILIDAQASRQAILRGLSGLLARVQPHDNVFVSFAGLGTVEKRAGAPASDAGAKALLLSGFDATTPVAEYRILLDEVREAVGAIDGRGASVLAVIDAGFGRDAVREADPRDVRSARIRSVPPVTVDAKERAPVRFENFTRSVLIEAGSPPFSVPEVLIAGAEPAADSWRGALSYGVARGIDVAVASGAGPSPETIAAYASILAYQASDQRQDVTLIGTTRGIKQVAGPGMQIKTSPTEAAPGAPKRSGPVMPIAALDGKLEHFKGLAPQEIAFVVVLPSENPVILWDTQKKEVIVAGDVIAQDVTRDDIPAIVDRTFAVRSIKQMTAKSPQPIVVLPGGGIHRQGNKIAVEIDDIANRALVLFSIAGNGKVQMLYPIGSDPPIITKSSYRLELVVQEPFGADQIVALTAPSRMNDIEQALNRLKDRTASGQLESIVTHYAPAKSRIGTVGIFAAR